MAILGRKSSQQNIRRLQRRTMVDRVDVYGAGADDGRGGRTAPQEQATEVQCAAKPMPQSQASEFLGERLRHQDPHAFFFAHDQTLPDQCYVLHEGTLYREEDRQDNDVRRLVVTVRAEDQSTA